jgi:hypothetical protein
MDKDGTAYNIPSILLLEGIVDKDKLVRTIAKLIRRHESLRTSIEVIEEEPVQRIHEHVVFEIENYDLAAKDVKGREEGRGDPAWSPNERAEKQIIMNFIRRPCCGWDW